MNAAEPRRACEPLAQRWGRRVLTIPLYALAAVVLVATMPAWAPLAFVADRLRPGLCTLRLLAFGLVFLFYELVGLSLAGALWLRSPFVPRLGASAPERASASRAAHYALQTRWVGWLFDAARRLFRLRCAVSGAEVLEQGPMLLLLRHTSLADTALAATQVTQRTGTALRYVLKRELLWDPCLDVVGHRLPNVFVDRDSDDPAREIARVRTLVDGLGPNEGVMIYPEGTRFTPERRARAIERLRAAGRLEQARQAEAMEHVLPPRLGGPVALLEANPGLDVVVCAHTGLEGAGTLGQCLRGELLDRTLRIHFWRIPFEALPRTREKCEEFSPTSGNASTSGSERTDAAERRRRTGTACPLLQQVELHATVGRAARRAVVGLDRRVLTQPERFEPVRADALQNEVVAHRVRAPLRQGQVGVRRTERVRMTGDPHAQARRAAERRRHLVQLGLRFGRDGRRAAREGGTAQDELGGRGGIEHGGLLPLRLARGLRTGTRLLEGSPPLRLFGLEPGLLFGNSLALGLRGTLARLARLLLAPAPLALRLLPLVDLVDPKLAELPRGDAHHDRTRGAAADRRPELAAVVGELMTRRGTAGSADHLAGQATGPRLGRAVRRARGAAAEGESERGGDPAIAAGARDQGARG